MKWDLTLYKLICNPHHVTINILLQIEWDIISTLTHIWQINSISKPTKYFICLKTLFWNRANIILFSYFGLFPSIRVSNEVEIELKYFQICCAMRSIIECLGCILCWMQFRPNSLLITLSAFLWIRKLMDFLLSVDSWD